jgi:hypothetical protein
MTPAYGESRASRGGSALRITAISCVFVALSVAATWPLLRDAGSLIASDAGDPALNASILLWNATTLPFSPPWWNAPHYYPAEGVTSFTENLASLSPIASPIYWATADAVLAYNVTLFLTWPLCAIAAYLLVRFITGRDDAAFIAGLSFGFTPYRAAGLGHMQTLAAFGPPLFLLGLHGFLETRRRKWLVLFGAAWLQSSLANGYFILFGAVLIGLWLLYFCSGRRTLGAGLAIVGAWAIASLPLAPMLLKYRAIHEHFGLHRTLNEILYFSAMPQSFLEVSSDVWLWRAVFPDGKDNLFPGLTAAAIVAAGLCLPLLRATGGPALPSSRRWLRVGFGAAAALSLLALLVGLRFGQVDTTIAGIPVRMRNINRALALLVLSGVPLLLMTPRTRDALARRSPLVFYAAATLVIAVLCCGPVLRVGEEVILSPAPYGWLLSLPGFNELRVPTQLRMLIVLCLAVAAGLSYAALNRPSFRFGRAMFAVLAIGLLLDGWMTGARMAPAPEMWTDVEPRDRAQPILELPLGPEWDYAATFRAAGHHRRVLNGVSGYDPPHYVALRAGLDARDPAMLAAIASLGAFDVVVNRAADPDGALDRFASSARGAVRVASGEHGTAYRVPQAAFEPALGDVLPIARVEGVRHEGDALRTHDGKIETGWGDYPQRPDGWLVIDLGEVREVGGLMHAIGEYLLDFPRRLAIEVSPDRQVWERVWEGSTAPQTFLAYVREPRVAALRFAFAARPARYVRLLQLESYPSMWRVSELQVHAPARADR